MLAIIDERTPLKICAELERHGYSLLRLPPHPSLPPPVASHPDMLLFFAKDKIICTRKYATIAKKELEILSRSCEKPISITEGTVSDQYPHDILLNAAPVGDFLFCNFPYTSKKITESKQYTICHTRQGYSKCATVSVGSRALITADPSIANAASHVGIDVLQISPAHIDLPGYDTGFIGGASSFTPYQEISQIYFCGNLSTHPDGDAIIEFCIQHNKTAVSLSDNPLFDLGTIFLI